MKTKLSLVAVLSIILINCTNFSSSECNNSDVDTTQTYKETFMLVHSAWLGAWQWESVSQELERDGYNVIANDLPGHGKDTTSANKITMDSYVNSIINTLDSQDEPVILVGHSFNGITINRVAELRPEKVKHLIYVTAFLVPNGTSFLSAVNGVKGSEAVDNFYVSDDGFTALVNEENLHSAFGHDIPEDIFNSTKQYIVPEPFAPLNYELEITEENFGAIDKYYVECTEDRAIPIEIQRAMSEGNVKEVFTLNTSHLPNFSKPVDLAQIFIETTN